jgi:hypothetical protein
MSFVDGWAALNLDMPRRVPHTEYSLEGHWEFISKRLGIAVDATSPVEVQRRASRRLAHELDLDLHWSILVGGDVFGSLRTDMGHAEYAAGGVDRRDTLACPFKTPEEALNLDFEAAYGMVDAHPWRKKFEQHYRDNLLYHADAVNMTGIYVTLISGLIDIFGWEMLLLAAGTDQPAFGRLAERYAAWVMPFFAALAEADVPVVMVHDDMVWSSGAFISPRWYRQYVFPAYRRLFDPLRQAGKKILFTSDGNFTAFMDDLVGCGVNGFVLEPLTDMAYIAEKYGRTHAFIGNADTRILLTGSREQIRAEVQRSMAIGKDCPGFMLAVGNHIPANTPVDAIETYLQAYEELCWR